MFRMIVVLATALFVYGNVSASEITADEKRVINRVAGFCSALLSGAQVGSGESALQSVQTEPIDFRGRTVGSRYRFQFEDRFEVRLDHINAEGQPERFVGEVSAPSSTFELLPVLFLGMDQECNLRQARRRVYSDSTPVKLEVFDPTFQVISSQLLNPEVATDDGTFPGRVRVAMLDSGVNYQLPEISRRLARDRHGDLLGYDFWELDRRPFDSQLAGSPFFVQRHGTRTASLLLKESPYAALVPYRYPRSDMSRMAAVVNHAAALGVRVMGMPLGSRKASDWQAFEQAANNHPEILFIVSAGNNGVNIDRQPVYPAALDLDNMLVVTSADDFQRPAERTNWGATSVDMLVPAENVEVLDFSGDNRLVSGSSYAVSRVAAMAVNILAEKPALNTSELKQEINRYVLKPGKDETVSMGYLPDPLAVLDDTRYLFVESNAEQSASPDDKKYGLKLSTLLLDPVWQIDSIKVALSRAAKILSQCGIAFNENEIFSVDSNSYLRDLSSGTAHTVLSGFSRVRPAMEQEPRVTLVFARDTRMQQAFEAEAFGEGNTGSRRWMQNSVWVMQGARDLGITLAHEIFHVLANDGSHPVLSGNLMSASTNPGNVNLIEDQCIMVEQFFPK